MTQQFYEGLGEIINVLVWEQSGAKLVDNLVLVFIFDWRASWTFP